MLPLLLLLACEPTPVVKDSTGPDTPHETGPAVDSEESGGGEGEGESRPDTDSGHSGDSDSGGHSGDTDTGDPVPATTPSVILFIGDGMGFEHVAGGGVYAYGASGTLTMETLPYQGRIRTASLSGITDSAAAATVYATGEKTWNDWLGLDRDGAELTTLLDLAQARGMATGIVSTDTLVGATPSAFLVHVPDRRDSTEIAAQMAANLPDVLLGGGSGALSDPLEGLDIQLVTTATELEAATLDDRPLVGLFASSTMPWVADGLGTAPTIAQMTEAALSRLETAPAGFFLMVEGARIDHASHMQNDDNAHPETAAFDEAIATALSWAEGRDDVTIVVTADHECGGMRVADTGTAGETPETEWRWGAHTNADVPVFAMGDTTSVVHEQRLDAKWVHAVLAAAIEEREVEEPETVPLIDGWLDELGEPITTQTWDTSFSSGYNQLDALRLDADEDGLRIGVDGVFDRGNNAVVLLVDVDYGEGTGLGGEGSYLPDTDGGLESILSSLSVQVGLDGLGFDLALVSLRAREMSLDEMEDDSGLRGLRDPWAYEGDLWWLPSEINLDDGNIAIDGEAAADAGTTGATEHGMEALLPWGSVWPDGLPVEGQTLAVFALLVNTTGSYASNQALPPLAEDLAPGSEPVPIDAVVVLEVDADGVAIGLPEVVE